MREEGQDQLKGAKSMELLPKKIIFPRPICHFLSLSWKVAATNQDKMILAWKVAATNQAKLILAWKVAACLRFSFLQEIFSNRQWFFLVLVGIYEFWIAYKNLWHLQCRLHHGLITFHTSAMSAICWCHSVKTSLSQLVAATFQAKLNLSWLVAATFQAKLNLSWKVAATNRDKLRIQWNKQVFCRFYKVFRPIFCFRRVFMYMTRIF